MLYETKFKCFDSVEVPDDARIEFVEKGTKVYIKNKKGVEYLFFAEEKTKIDHPARMFEQRFFDDKGRLHRDENQGPALIGSRDFYVYCKHGKKHRVAGPAFKTATGEEKYYLDDKELTKQLWEHCVKNNNKKPIKKFKISLNALKKVAAELGCEARATSSINGHAVSAEDVVGLIMTTEPKYWAFSHSRMNPDGSFETCLNCKPFDDTLRCYITVAQDGKILESYLQIE
jgi:hypothetical protein